MGPYRKRYLSSSHLVSAGVRPNHWSGPGGTALQAYLVQKAALRTLCSVRNTNGVCPPEIVKLTLEALRYNDNSQNVVLMILMSLKINNSLNKIQM